MLLAVLLTQREIDQLKILLKKQPEQSPALQVALSNPLPDLAIESFEILGAISLVQSNTDRPNLNRLKNVVMEVNKAHSAALTARINSSN